MSGAQAGVPIEAVLIGVDTSSGKVWLSARQVQPDPLQETLNALLAQGPPAGSPPGAERLGLTRATDLSSDPADFNEDEFMVRSCLVVMSDVQSLEWFVEAVVLQMAFAKNTVKTEIDLQTGHGCIEKQGLSPGLWCS